MTGIPNVRHHDVCTCVKCNTKANRIAAFGAIRRAVAIARMYDAKAERIAATCEDPDKQRWDWREGTIGVIDGHMFDVVGHSIGECENAAGSIRCAIRAAMKQDAA